MRSRSMAWMAALALAVIGGPLAAQGPPGGGGGGGGFGRGLGAAPSLDELKTALSLTEEQQAKVQTLLDQFQADTKEARETVRANLQMVRDGSATMDAVRAENAEASATIRTRSEKLNTDLRALLTPEQQKAFDEFLAARRAQRGPGRRPPPA